ncbi:carboxypeptidase-like regulatory domain-containing protein [Algoriphagus halophilus]|uniref:carboxypeptidase-like regulatory domain-containing protein n=1 Tax=Algoriphagus halophilus TaxID=226505 RepID=UPI00358F482A
MNQLTNHHKTSGLKRLLNFRSIPEKTRIVLFSALFPVLTLVSMTFAHDSQTTKHKNQVVNGKVICASRDMIGSVVSVKGTSTETITDTFGNFTLDLSNVNQHEVTLEFNKEGFEEKEITVNLKTLPKILEIVTLERAY